MSKTYSELLKDPRWKKKRTEILIRDKYTCMHCSATGVVLHVHHEKYEGLSWEVSNRYLKTLCEKCHGLIHKEGKRNLSFRQPSQVRGILLSAMKKSNISYIILLYSIMAIKKNMNGGQFVLDCTKSWLYTRSDVDFLIEDRCIVCVNKEKNKYIVNKRLRRSKGFTTQKEAEMNLYLYLKKHDLLKKFVM